MRKMFSMLIMLLFVVALSAQGRAKYVFYFIGDGMGADQVNGTEMFLAEKNGIIGYQPLTFTQFPIMSVVNTYSRTNSVTDSSAAGTALATGCKTYNGAIGVDLSKEPIYSVAVKAKQSGKSVGVITSVSVDHATPAAFYAHQPDRNMYYEIALDLPKAGFDFYAGSGFIKPNTSFDGKEMPSIYPIFDNAGYSVSHGLDEYKSSNNRDKIILIQDQKADQHSLPYAIDRKAGDMSLKDLTSSAIEVLSENKKGFFLMVEGGKIDWACHDNDAATAFYEVVDMDNAIALAYDFYKKHPKETLIVVSADHETGGMSLGVGKYELNLKALQHQKVSAGVLSDLMKELRQKNNNKVSWEQMKEFLGEYMGFWKELDLTWEQEKKLRNEFENSFVKNKKSFEESMYTKSEPLAARAKEVMSQIAMVNWASHSHSANYVPVFSIGVGSEQFKGRVDNIEIPKKIAKAAGYKW